VDFLEVLQTQGRKGAKTQSHIRIFASLRLGGFALDFFLSFQTLAPSRCSTVFPIRECPTSWTDADPYMPLVVKMKISSW
jgi:hypothetical protein